MSSSAAEEKLLDRLGESRTVTIDLGGGGGPKDKTDQFAREAARVGQQLANLRLQAEAAGQAADAVARLEAAERLRAAATADGTAVSAEEAAVIANLMREIGAAADSEREAARAAEDFKRSVDGLAQDLGDALGGLVTGTLTWKAALGQVLQTVLRIAETQLTSDGFLSGAGSFLSGIGNAIFSGLGFADGAAFHRGNVVAFAGGGVVGSPTFFPMSGGRTGLMGEAGPEAIMPLVRTAGGKLGVRSEGSGGGAPTFAFSIDARGSTMSPGEFRMIARQESERAVALYNRTVAAPSVRMQSVRMRS